MTSTLDLSFAEIKSLINSKLQAWKDQGFIESSEITNEDVVVTFNEHIFNPFYRKFHASIHLNGYGIMGGVVFTFPTDTAQAMEDMDYHVV